MVSMRMKHVFLFASCAIECEVEDCGPSSMTPGDCINAAIQMHVMVPRRVNIRKELRGSLRVLHACCSIKYQLETEEKTETLALETSRFKSILNHFFMV